MLFPYCPGGQKSIISVTGLKWQLDCHRLRGSRGEALPCIWRWPPFSGLRLRVYLSSPWSHCLLLFCVITRWLWLHLPWTIQDDPPVSRSGSSASPRGRNKRQGKMQTSETKQTSEADSDITLMLEWSDREFRIPATIMLKILMEKHSPGFRRLGHRKKVLLHFRRLKLYGEQIVSWLLLEPYAEEKDPSYRP